MQTVGVQVQRRRFEGRGIDRDLPARRRERGVVEVLDRQVPEIVVVVDDQALTRIDAQRRCRVDVVARGRAVRTRALQNLVTEDQEARHRFRDGVEVDRA